VRGFKVEASVNLKPLIYTGFELREAYKIIIIDRR